MKKYLCTAILVASNFLAGVGYYALYQQNKQLTEKIGQLEMTVMGLRVQIYQLQPKKEENALSIYKRLQSLDNKIGEWIKKR